MSNEFLKHNLASKIFASAHEIEYTFFSGTTERVQKIIFYVFLRVLYRSSGPKIKYHEIKSCINNLSTV